MCSAAPAQVRSADSHYGWIGAAPPRWVAGLPAALRPLAANTARTVDLADVGTPCAPRLAAPFAPTNLAGSIRSAH